MVFTFSFVSLLMQSRDFVDDPAYGARARFCHTATELKTTQKVAVFSCCETAKERWRELETGRAIFKNSILKSFSRCTAYNPSASVELGKLQRRVVRVHVHVYTYDVRCASLMHYV